MDKTKDAARLAKLTVSLTGEKDALKKAYIELGKAYYEEHHNDAEGLYAQLVEEVDAVNARIEEMQAEIDALKGSFHVSEDASFENVVAQDEDDGDEDISVEITVEEEPEAPAAGDRGRAAGRAHRRVPGGGKTLPAAENLLPPENGVFYFHMGC